MQPQQADREHKAQQLLSLDEQWKECCHNFTELIVPSLEEMAPNPFNKQKRSSEVNDLATVLSSHQFIALLTKGFEQLVDNHHPEVEQFLSNVIQQIESISQPLDPSNVVNLTTLLQIDEHYISAIERVAMHELEKGELYERPMEQCR